MVLLQIVRELMAIAIGNRDSFISDYIFISTNVYIQLIFVGFETNEYKVIFIQFDFNWPHIFVGDMAYIHRLTDKYMECRTTVTGPP
jgi:hypothetical protein